MNINNSNERKHIHIDKLEDGRLVIDAENINSEDIVYLLTEFIYFISNENNKPADGFVDIIKKAVQYKMELEKEKRNHSECD
ncbi:hypothetical protein [Brachyspira pilosicoli]|uniref:hypothetical protein n=1 Tax=Brachyspira pilosicoli TaxID=52584 RepID=UPI000E1ADF55|nr:hypothetical protein [Brachyspira pilosicoli]SUW04334.1 Uncharacterised protein [Brachyspira pilosicoli]SUW07999.1 Uncharacterised protein [Brachyspira pilosicoli]